MMNITELWIMLKKKERNQERFGREKVGSPQTENKMDKEMRDKEDVGEETLFKGKQRREIKSNYHVPHWSQ